MVVDLHTRLGVYVLGADNLTVSLQSLQLEKLGCRQKLNNKKKKMKTQQLKLKLSVCFISDHRQYA